MGGERAGREVGDAAGRERDHDGDRARWIGLRARQYGLGRRRAGDERNELAAPHVLPSVRGIASYHIALENAALCDFRKSIAGARPHLEISRGKIQVLGVNSSAPGMSAIESGPSAARSSSRRPGSMSAG